MSDVITFWGYKLDLSCCLSLCSGLRAGDEILKLNSKPASVLELADMQAAFSLPSLTLTVSMLPATDPHQLCQLPPRRSDGAQDLCTDIFSQSQGKFITAVFFLSYICLFNCHYPFYLALLVEEGLLHLLNRFVSKCEIQKSHKSVLEFDYTSTYSNTRDKLIHIVGSERCLMFLK